MARFDRQQRQLGLLTCLNDGKERLEGDLIQAMADLRKHRDIGSFVISEEPMNVLSGLFDDLGRSVEIGKQHSFIEYLDYRVGAVDRALASMREVAKRDLRYPGSW